MKFYTHVKKYYNLFKNLFPSSLPQGITEFNNWAQSIIDDYGFPDNDSVRFALATMVMHQGPTAAYRSKFYFALMVKAGAAKQVASQVFTNIKTLQLEAAKNQAEVPAPGASDGPKV